MGMSMVCIHNGQRLTAASAYLSAKPENLSIISDTLISRVIFREKRAMGVQTISGTEFHAKCEVILCGGAINTPQLLLLSGIGPADQLRQHGIDLILDQPRVGKDLQDHCFSSLGVVLDRPNHSGVAVQSPTPMGWFKISGLTDTTECMALEKQIQQHRLRDTVSDFEIATVGLQETTKNGGH